MSIEAHILKGHLVFGESLSGRVVWKIFSQGIDVKMPVIGIKDTIFVSRRFGKPPQNN
jgi:hypothetical protein